MSFTLRRQLSSTLWSQCRLIVDPYLDDDSSAGWYASKKGKDSGDAQVRVQAIADAYCTSDDATTSDSGLSSADDDSEYDSDDDSFCDSDDDDVDPMDRSRPARASGARGGRRARLRRRQLLPTNVTWPQAEVPVEIFELIASHLSRAEVKTLRLVSREFESKVSGRYFKNVVVPFRSELYGRLSRDSKGALQHPSSAFFSNGMRIFESFGPHILRFALSLELDEDALAHPPLKPTQEAISTFWGMYRWPHQNYNRYADLEGIEQTADETQGMKDAMRCLSKVTNLGLCCDAGLGFLVRPDRHARGAKSQHPVFATRNWRREHRRTSVSDDDDEPIVTIADFNGHVAPRRKASCTDPVHYKRNVLEKMARDAGFKGAEINEAIDLLLQSENINLSDIDFDERSVALNNAQSTPALPSVDEMELGARGWTVHRADNGPSNTDVRRHPLIPAHLTRAQKELLLELEWAHRAMIQSYVLAMIDNASQGCYSSLTTLTIAKIPSSHVHILYRDDFWGCFPNLTNVSIGVIADWRSISKPAPGCIDDTPVSPLESVGKVFKLLNSYIGNQPKIESLHFEWICGGEFAPSAFQRNQYILPAPFLEDPERMTEPFGPSLDASSLLKLPHIKHLSLKNCWSSPQVLLQTVRQMGLSSLEKLELESVSLSGQPTQVPQFPLHLTQVQIAPPGNPANFVPAVQVAPWPAAENNPAAAPEPPTPTSPASVQVPDLLTWSGLLEHFSPGAKIRNMFEDDDDVSDASRQAWQAKVGAVSHNLHRSGRLIGDERRYKLRCLSLKSCGYVAIDSVNTDTRALLPAGTQVLGGPVHEHLHSLSPLMQRSKDRLMGRIVPYLHAQELFNLTEAFDMTPGWDDIYSDKMIEEAIADGVDVPGMGRFTGIIQAHHNGWGLYSSADGSSDNTESSSWSE
jgi:hypothetical protein